MKKIFLIFLLSLFLVAQASAFSPIVVCSGVPTYLGENIATNGEFTTNTTGWIAVNDATIARVDCTSAPDIDPTGGSDEYALEIAYNGTTSPMARSDQTVVTGATYRVTVRAYTDVLTSSSLELKLYNGSVVLYSGLTFSTVEGSWVTLTHPDITATDTTLKVYLIASTATAGEKGYFDAVSVKRVY